MSNSEIYKKMIEMISKFQKKEITKSELMQFACKILFQVSNIKFLSNDEMEELWNYFFTLLTEIGNRPEGNTLILNLKEKYEDKLKFIQFPIAPWAPIAFSEDMRYNPNGYANIMEYIFKISKFISYPINQDSPQDYAFLYKFVKEFFEIIKNTPQGVNIYKSIMDFYGTNKKIENDYISIISKIKNDPTLILQHSKTICSNNLRLYEDYRYANGLLLALYDFLEGGTLPDLNSYFKEKHHAGEDMYFSPRLDKEGNLIRKRWRNNKFMLIEYFEKYNSILNIYWKNIHGGIHEYRVNFAHHQDDVLQNRLNEGIISFFDRAGDSKYASMIELQKISEFLWGILNLLDVILFCYIFTIEIQSDSN